MNKDKFIENIEINKTSESKLVDKWFENTNSIPLNSGLIAIIGNKGNGKSALADIIALSGNVKLPDGDWFSFLNTKRFKDKKLLLASNFESKLTWLNNTGETVNLNNTIPESSIEKVKYLPQKYIEKIAASLIHNNDTLFITSSSTCLEFANHIKPDLRLNILTNGMPLAHKLSENNNVTVECPSGIYNYFHEGIYGKEVKELISKRYAQYCFTKEGNTAIKP